MPQPATLQDVARRARVHRTTVSLALRDHPRIPAATRRRIKVAATKLGYRINPLVSALMQSRRSGNGVKHVTIAYVTCYPTRYGWKPGNGHNRPNFFPGATERAAELGYDLEHFWLAEPGLTEERFSNILSSRGIHGMIIGRLPPGKHRIDLEWSRFSVVALGMTLRSPRLHHVAENHFETARLAMGECLDRGYRRIGFLFSEANDSPRVGDRWLAAYLRSQLQLPAAERIPVCPGEPADAERFIGWFREHQPEALLTNHAPPVIRWLREIGREVPRDVGLVELEDHPELGSSGVWYDPDKVGALAVEMLVGLMNRNETGVPSDPHEVLISGAWREGRSLRRPQPHRRAEI